MAARALASHNGPPAKASAGAPSSRYEHMNLSSRTSANQSSLYIKNLPEKLQKQDLRTSLYTLFSTYGPVLDVVAIKTAHMRGQAHVVFREAQTSTQAMRALQDFEFFGKEMVGIASGVLERKEVLTRGRKLHMEREGRTFLHDSREFTRRQRQRQLHYRRPRSFKRLFSM